MSQGLNDTAALEARVVALEAQLQRYKAAFDAISQGVCLFDNAQRVIVGNAPYAEIFYGLSPDRDSLPEQHWAKSRAPRRRRQLPDGNRRLSLLRRVDQRQT